MRYAYTKSPGDLPPYLRVQVHVKALGGMSKVVWGKIDTGADCSMVPERVAEQVGATAEGFCTVVGPLGERQRARTCIISVSMDGVRFDDVEAVVASKEYFLVGRDVLNKLILRADGSAGVFDLDYPS